MQDHLLSLTLEVGIDVDRARTVDFFGEDFRIYATPCLVNDIERACITLLASHLGEGECSVGTGLTIVHEAPTFEDEHVDIRVEVVATEGRNVSFSFRAADRFGQIASGLHQRHAVLIVRMRQKLSTRTKQDGVKNPQ